MTELLEDWPKGETRDRALRMRDPQAAVPLLPGREQDEVEPFGTCSVCAAPRALRTEPHGTGTARLTLVCDTCGTRTEI